MGVLGRCCICQQPVATPERLPKVDVVIHKRCFYLTANKVRPKDQTERENAPLGADKET